MGGLGAEAVSPPVACWPPLKVAPWTRKFSLATDVGNMSGKITVLTTEDTADKAAKVAEVAGELEGASVATDEVKSFYWWEGKVQFDPEWRVAVSTTAPFSSAQEEIAKAHSYDLPMIIYDLSLAPEDHPHWKGLLECGEEATAIKLAQALVEQRVVACAQATPTGGLAVKTVAACKGRVEETSGQAVTWFPISGNEGYLKWLDEECVAA